MTRETDEIKALLAKGKIDKDDIVSIKTEYRTYRDKLNNTVNNWLKTNK